MGELGELYGVPADAPPMQRAVAQRAAEAAAAMRARSHGPKAAPVSVADARVMEPENQDVLAGAEWAAAQEEIKAAQDVRDREGGAQAPPGPVPADGLGGMRQASQQDAMRLAGMQDRGFVDENGAYRGKRTVKSANPRYGMTKEWISEADAVNAEREGNAELLHTEQAGLASERARLANDTHQQMSQMQMRQEFMAEQQARKRADIEDNVAKYAVAADEAAEEFAKTESFSRGAAWADRSAGQKVGIFLASLGRGMRGGNPSDVFSEVLQRELQAHKQIRRDASEKLGSARANRDNAQNRMASFLALTGDERVADKLVEMTTLRGIDAKMNAMEVDFGAKLQNAQWSAARNELRQRMADTELQIRDREANNKTHTYKTVDTMGSATRAALEGMQEGEIKAMGEASKQYAGMQRDAAKASGEGAARLEQQQEKQSFEQKKWLAESTKDLRVQISAIEDFEKAYADDIPGVHALSRFTPDAWTRQWQDNRTAKKMMMRPVMLRLREESGQGTTEMELQREAEAFVDAMSEEDVRGEFTRRKKEARQKLDYLTHATSTDLEAEYLGRPVGDRKAMLRGGGAAPEPASLVMDE